MDALNLTQGESVRPIAKAQVEPTGTTNPTYNLAITKNGTELTNQTHPAHAGDIITYDTTIESGAVYDVVVSSQSDAALFNK